MKLVVAFALTAFVLGCSSPDAARDQSDGGSPLADGAASPDATVSNDAASSTDASGGADLASGSLMTFAVFGDCRASTVDDATTWPTMIVTSIFMQAQSMGAQFMIGTGDYTNADTPSDVATQMGLLMAAQKQFSGPVYYAMGNHECLQKSSINCPLGNESPNIQAFLAQLVPSGVTTPYYRIDVPTPLGKAKIVVIAGNAWTDAQGTWLTQQLADPTTYTFVVRHESIQSNKAPGTAPSEAMVQAAPYTLEFLAHQHEYLRVDNQHVISGNGGAPLDNGNYGFLLVQQLSDGNVAVTEIDQATGSQIDTWKVTPAGQAVP